MKLYKKINIENFDLIRHELEIATANNVSDNIRFWDVPYIWFKTNSPLLYEFIEARKKIPIRLCRFYLTPPYQHVLPHIDGLTTNKSPWGLNIPIIGYKNTTMSWYTCPENNFKVGPYGFNDINASKVIDMTKINLIESTCIDSPTLVRTDVAHGVANNNPYPRLVLSIRCYYSVKLGREFSDGLNLEGI